MDFETALSELKSESAIDLRPLRASLGPSSPGGIAVCEHCGSQAAFATTVASATDLENELEQVEKSWSDVRRPLMSPDRRGNLHPPEEQPVLFVTLVALGGILALLSAVAGQTWNWNVAGVAGFFLFPVLISLPAGLQLQRAEARFKEYKKLEAEYEGRRTSFIEWHARLS